jgi:hypothetical protein
VRCGTDVRLETFLRRASTTKRSDSMRKTFIALAAVAALSSPALAQQPYNPAAPTEATVGVVTGTAVGVGLNQGWISGSVGGAALPATVAGAATVGGVAGVGTVAAIDAAVQPCAGFHALFGANHGACVNGQYVGYAPPRRVVR